MVCLLAGLTALGIAEVGVGIPETALAQLLRHTSMQNQRIQAILYQRRIIYLMSTHAPPETLHLGGLCWNTCNDATMTSARHRRSDGLSERGT